MALQIIKEDRNAKVIVVRERIVVVLDGSRIAGPGESGRLLAPAGGWIALADAERLGIGADGLIKRAPMAPAAPIAPVVKECAPAATKEILPAETKAAPVPEPKAPRKRRK